MTDARPDDLRATIEAARADGHEHQIRCPAHDDRRASLSVGRGDDGRILLRCHAGCTTESVLQAAGLSWSDLMPAQDKSSFGRATIVSTYDYRDEHGELLYQVVRMSPKSFRQRRPDGDEWSWSVRGVRRVVYHLHELQGRSTVWIVEGERDVDRLWSMDIPATCNPGGAGKWNDDYTAQLVDAGVQRVVILPDADNPGRQHADQAARSCHAAGLAVKVVELPGLTDKQDVSDWLASAHGRDELVATVKSAARYEPPADEKPQIGTGEVIYRRLADVQARPIDWLWPWRFARGKVSLIAGDPGLGKSQITASLAAIVSTGGQWPVDRTRCQQGNVVVISAEDDAADTIVPRLQAAGADLERCFKFDAVRVIDDDGERQRSFSLLTDISRLEEVVARVGGASLVVVDPVSAFLGSGKIDSHNTTDIRGVMLTLQELAERTGASVICISHLSKGRQRQALMAVMGSLGWVAAARAAYGVFRDDESDGRRRLMLPLKNNVGDDTTGFAFSIEPVELDDGIATSRIAWEADPVTNSADAIYAPEANEDGAGTATQEAIEFLHDALADGPRPVPEVKAEARKADIAAKTLRRARERLGIKASRERFDGNWEWKLPDHDHPSPHGHDGQDGHDGGETGAVEGQDGAAPDGHDGGAHRAHVAHDAHRDHTPRDGHNGQQLLAAACEGTNANPGELYAALDDDDRADLEAGEIDPAALRHLASRLGGAR